VSEDCSKVLDAVIASYQDFLKETYQDVNAETLELITRARDVLQKDIATKEAAYGEFRRNTPVLWKGKDGITVQQDRLFNIDARRSTLRMRQAEINASLQAIDKAKREGRSRGEILSLVSGLPANQEILSPTHFGNSDPTMAGRTTRVTLEEELVKLQLDEKRLLESYGSANPEVQAIRNRIRHVTDLITPSSASEGSGSNPSVWDADLVNLKIQLLKQELVENERADKALRDLFEHDQTDAKAAIVHEIEDEAHRTGIERSKVLYDSIVTRLREIDSVQDYGGYNTQIIAAPKSGLNKRKYLIVFLGALLTGVLAGFGWACLAEFRDKSFRTSREIRAQLGLPVLGHIPYFRPRAGKVPTPESQGAPLDPSLCTYAEAYLAVREALYHATKARQCRVIQITSPIHGEGKTTLAANLAVSMAQSGQRVVLIDGDLRRPRLAELFGVSKPVGLTSVLAGETDLAVAIQPSAVPGLSILGSGPISPNPAEAVASPRLRTLLDSLRPQCDYVLIDTPPLLAVTDPRLVARSVDGVLLTLRNSNQSRPLAQSAREILDAAGANILGVVVNGVAGQCGYANNAYAPLSGRRGAPRFKASRL
jgi:capsular exopolysaccharide synthesis family protein